MCKKVRTKKNTQMWTVLTFWHSYFHSKWGGKTYFVYISPFSLGFWAEHGWLVTNKHLASASASASAQSGPERERERDEKWRVPDSGEWMPSRLQIGTLRHIEGDKAYSITSNARVTDTIISKIPHLKRWLAGWHAVTPHTLQACEFHFDWGQRERAKEKERERERDLETERERAKEKERERDLETERESERERERERATERERLRDRERERAKEKERERDLETERESERERGRERATERERLRDRERESEREIERERET